MKKRILALMTCFCLVLLLCVGCSNDDTSADNGSDNGSDNVVSDIIDDIQDEVGQVLDDLQSDADNAKDDLTDDADDVKDDIKEDADDLLAEDDGSTLMNQNESDVSLSDTSLSVLAGVDWLAFDALDQTLYGWGQGSIVNEENVPVGCIDFNDQFGQYDAEFVRDEVDTIYLTFDEGYENGYTAEILDVLAQKDCPAVFFVTMDYVESEPALVERMIAEGHVVGNHSTTHPSMASISVEQQVTEITTLHDYVSTVFGYEMSLFRPPMGEFSMQSLAVTQALDYRSVFWSFAYVDWQTDAQPDPDEALVQLTEAAHDGAVYLLHAVSATNASILGDWIDAMRAEGYEFGSYPVNA